MPGRCLPVRAPGAGHAHATSYEALGSRSLALAAGRVIPSGRGAYAPDDAALAHDRPRPDRPPPRATSTRTWSATTRSSTRRAPAGADLVVFPELGLTGYQLQDLASEVAMRLDDPRLTALAAETRGLSAVVSFVEESGDHRLFIAAALLEDGEIRHVHRKVYLPTYGLFDERRFFAAGRRAPGRAVPAGRRDRDRRLRGLLAPRRARDPRARRRPDPDQRVVVAGPRPRGHERGRPRHRDLVADAHARLRPADDVVRDLLQPRRRRRVDLVLGRLRGDRPERGARLQRPALRRGAVHRSRSPPATSGASGSPCRCCATSARSSTSASCRGSSPSARA